MNIANVEPCVCPKWTLPHDGNGPCVPEQPNANTYEYLHDVLDGAIFRLEGAERSAQDDPLCINAMRHIRSSVLQAKAALAASPPVRTQSGSAPFYQPADGAKSEGEEAKS